jgi:hypothetical protein
MRTFFALVFVTIALTTTTFANPSEEDKIKNLINISYVEGIHNLGSLEEVAKGFHPDFEMLINKDGNLTKLSIASWIENMKKNRANNPHQVIERTEINYLSIDITGNAAVAKFELIKGGKVIFTDYMFLYRFGENWKIVSKIFYRH